MALRSGERIDADVIVTATGIQLQALGGVALSIDGAEVKPQDRFVYKEHLLEDVPNAAWCVGYINASWTLRADLTARAVAKLLAYMDSHGYTHAYPHLGDVPMPEKPAWNINAGYVQRAAARVAEVRNPPAVECATQLRAGRDRSPLRPHRGVDGVRSCRCQVGAVGVAVAVGFAVTIAIAVFFLGMGVYALAAPATLIRPFGDHAGVADVAFGDPSGLRRVRAGDRRGDGLRGFPRG